MGIVVPSLVMKSKFNNIAVHRVQPALKPHPQIKNVIVVASGKGGVGKSTTAINLALALQLEGATVGLLDADIHGPNQPHMLGSDQLPDRNEQKQLLPVERYGLSTMSMGYLIDAATPMVWRGPMVSQALVQLWQETLWPSLDFLIVDMPPGTGDIQLSLSKKIPVAGAVIVTTPQDIALLDARKGLEMFRKVKVNVLGIIENMSQFVCGHCGQATAIFGEGGAKKIAADCDVPVLGQIPLTPQLREALDHGQPLLVTDPEGEVALRYREIALNLYQQLAATAKDYSHKFANIVVEKKE